MHFRPLHDRVLVRRIDAEERTTGGIIIPDTAKEKPQESEVLAVGPVAATNRANWCHSTWSPATGCCSANGLARRSRSTAKSLLGVVEKTSTTKKAA